MKRILCFVTIILSCAAKFIICLEIDSSEYGGPPGNYSTNCPCGWANKDQGPRIAGGNETGENEFPFMAGLTTLDKMYLICGASIITEYHSLTAAHCTINETRINNSLAVYIGEHYLMKGDESDLGETYLFKVSALNSWKHETYLNIFPGLVSSVSHTCFSLESTSMVIHDLEAPRKIGKASENVELIRVKRVIEHENYEEKNQLFDIALLVLEKKIETTTIKGPSCLPTGKLDLEGKFIKVLGWGKVKQKGGRSKVLRKVNIEVVSIKKCADSFEAVIPIETPQQICTFTLGKDACYGDSGGPVLWLDPDTNRYIQVGIVSYGSGCASTTPGVQTDLTYFVGWLKEKIAETESRGIICSKTKKN